MSPSEGPCRESYRDPVGNPVDQATDLIFTAQEVADMLKISRATVRLATVNGDLPHRQFGDSVRSIRYTRDDISSFIEARARSGLGVIPEEAVRRLPAPRVRSPRPEY